VRDEGSPEVHPRWESCTADGPRPSFGFGGATDAGGLPALDDSFTPVAAVLCRTAPLKRVGGGEDMVAGEDRATDIAALVAALRLPDEKRSNGPCTADLVLPPWLALLDASGRWIRPGIPVDACGKPRREFRDALAALKTTRVAGHTVGQIESDAAAQAGCSRRWADMAWVTSRNSPPTASPPVFAPDDAAVGVCVYRVPAGERGGMKPAGDFQSGGKLPAGRWAAIRKALTATGPATRCTTPAGRFAVLRTPTGDVYVQADGCRQVFVDHGGALRTASPALLSLIF
jgi:hypothetical protein